MLVLSRKVGEKLVLSGGIEVEVVEIRRNHSVRLGITAPPEVKVARAEVLGKHKDEQQVLEGRQLQL